MDVPSSPPPGGADSLAWYKLQYEQLEGELAEFRESSRELEAELEKDIELAEKRERTLKERAETLGFEVEEWKRKYKESKAEASSSQQTLEKEITSLRDTNRKIQLRLREIEVANDDYERQARNTTSSLEDMESKYNQVIERSVMLEEEMKFSEQEREQSRIETQRLKAELNDLKIEAELLQDKVKKYESRQFAVISPDISVMSSPMFDKSVHGSPGSTASSPLISTPDSTIPPIDPPSPPMSDASGAQIHRPKLPLRTPTMATKRSRLPSLSASDSTTPKPRSKIFSTSVNGDRPPTSATPASATTNTRKVSSVNLKTPSTTTRTSTRTSGKAPASNSLSHIRSLTAQMQRLEARVHSARSKLPAPVNTPPRGTSPREIHIPSTITVRSRKRTLTSATSSVVSDDSTTPSIPRMPEASTRPGIKHVSRLSSSGVGRLSFGPLPNRSPNTDTDTSISRPSSRTSISSGIGRPSSRTEISRPASRTSTTSSRAPYARPRSSMSGSVQGYGHSHSRSRGTVDFDIADEGEMRTPSRRGAYTTKVDFSASVGSAQGIPTHSAIPLPAVRRQSVGRRTSSGVPSTGFVPSGTLAELEETY
ncbi:Nuclear distribution protein nudE -like protein 1 [Ceratocystis fimbriata CBS 114723]|uniref:Nuclear distribution protein nudE-like protein 1 n=1 Tax=Ceratocystis fimbriata CBS 114723 TaxID=1035309 RepID=A0A2C5X325_9PEZI|nr:Nuclear distribution protein nudE -like protein 1 [Ceratocystis fimbriata CBS 114723]